MNEHNHKNHETKEVPSEPREHPVKHITKEFENGAANNNKAILISGVLISLSILLHGAMAGNTNKTTKSGLVDKNVIENIMKQSTANRYFGDQMPTEEIVFTVYSDTECPFCKNFHQTMATVLDEGKGKYAWVNKHFPLSFHPKAQKQAEAVECVRSISGDTAGFYFLDSIFAVTPSNNKLPDEAMYEIADIMKISQKKLKTCLDEGKFSAKVKAEIEEGVKKGVQGTPFTFVTQNKEGKATELGSINGAQPREAIDALLSQVK